MEDMEYQFTNFDEGDDGIKFNDNGSLDFESVKEFIKNNCGKLFSIDDAIIDQRYKDSLQKKAFTVLKEQLFYVSNNTDEVIMRLRILKLKLLFLKLYCNLFNYQHLEFVESVSFDLGLLKEDIKQIKSLLKVIKKAINKLEKNNTSVCNFQLYELIDLLYEKEGILLNNYAKHIEINRLYLNGINCVSSNKNQEVLTDIENKIDESIKTLGLHN